MSILFIFCLKLIHYYDIHEKKYTFKLSNSSLVLGWHKSFLENIFILQLDQTQCIAQLGFSRFIYYKKSIYYGLISSASELNELSIKSYIYN